MRGMTLKLWPEEAERLSCTELLEYEPVGPHWNRLLMAFHESLRGFKRFILLTGSYGAGKTLLLRKLIAEFGFIEPRIVPFYISLRTSTLRSECEAS